MVFRAIPEPSCSQCEALLEGAPDNPFRTPAYRTARAASGERAWLLTDEDAPGGEGACLAFAGTARSGGVVEIPSAPAALPNPGFWNGLMAWCRDEGVVRLQIQTFASASLRLPRGRHELWRRPRREFVCDLRPEGEPLSLSSHHRRQVARAHRAGLTLRVRTDAAAAAAHGALVDASAARRRARGESVAGHPGEGLWRGLLQAEAAVVYQAVHDDQPVSSLLVLLAPRGAYYHSAGTAPDGMQRGASHFLVAATARALRHRGVQRFNLAGAGPDETGLARFKAGFGGREVALEATGLWLGSPWMLALRRGVGVLRRYRTAGHQSA